MRSLPDNFKNSSRKDEIINWFKNNHIEENFVIIDDDKSLNDLPDYLKKNLILVSSYIGLTEENIGEAKSILHKDPQVV